MLFLRVKGFACLSVWVCMCDEPRNWPQYRQHSSDTSYTDSQKVSGSALVVCIKKLLAWVYITHIRTDLLYCIVFLKNMNLEKVNTQLSFESVFAQELRNLLQALVCNCCHAPGLWQLCCTARHINNRTQVFTWQGVDCLNSSFCMSHVWLTCIDISQMH